MIRNKTVYNQSLIHESMKVIRKPTVTVAVASMMIILFLGVGLYLLNDTTYGLIYIGIAVIFILLLGLWTFLKLRQVEKQSLKRIQTQFGKDSYTCDMLFDAEAVHMDIEGSKHDVPHTDLVKLDETEHLMVLSYRTKLFLFVDKSSFSEGTTEGLKALLQPFCK